MWTIAQMILGWIVKEITAWQDRRAITLQGKIDIAKAKIEQEIKKTTADIDWDQAMAEASDHSWKDEWWTVILTVPLIMLFVPFLSKYAQDGFERLTLVPEWYRIAVGIAIAAAFGYRKFVDYIARR